MAGCEACRLRHSRARNRPRIYGQSRPVTNQNKNGGKGNRKGKGKGKGEGNGNGKGIGKEKQKSSLISKEIGLDEILGNSPQPILPSMVNLGCL